MQLEQNITFFCSYQIVKFRLYSVEARIRCILCRFGVRTRRQNPASCFNFRTKLRLGKYLQISCVHAHCQFAAQVRRADLPCRPAVQSRRAEPPNRLKILLLSAQLPAQIRKLIRLLDKLLALAFCKHI